MDTYEPLTKLQTDDNGNQMVVCRWQGTEQCQIHKPGGCSNCPIFKAILKTLNAFEDVYKETLYEKWTGGNTSERGVLGSEDI